MKNIKRTITIVLLLLIGNFIKAQDIHFSQFYNSPLTLNPANTGVFNGGMRFIANYKDQWGKVTTPFKTYGFSYDAGIFRQKWTKGYMGAGISIFNDKAGDSKMGLTQVNLSISCLRKLNKSNTLTAGIQGGFAQKSVSTSSLTWDNQYNGLYHDPNMPNNEQSVSPSFFYQDYSAGILWNYSKSEIYTTANNHFQSNLGVSLLHINKPNQSFLSQSDRLYQKLVIHGGLSVGIKNTNASIVPSFLTVFQGKSKEISLGTLIKYNLITGSHYTGYIKNAAVYFGGHYRWSDAVVLTAQVEVSDWLLGISYDVNTSKLTTASKGMGGLEISLRYINPLKGKFKPKF
ncbi:MAG: PorP/SprF family type IX secretion system membrane protein [Bacteroidetes bacterium]|nr:PorP/SprF family type IX secretion system membrane protein [Bacteroidota bacterium]